MGADFQRLAKDQRTGRERPAQMGGVASVVSRWHRHDVSILSAGKFGLDRCLRHPSHNLVDVIARNRWTPTIGTGGRHQSAPSPASLVILARPWSQRRLACWAVFSVCLSVSSPHPRATRVDERVAHAACSAKQAVQRDRVTPCKLDRLPRTGWLSFYRLVKVSADDQ
jgi:hypothetical protein